MLIRMRYNLLRSIGIGLLLGWSLSCKYNLMVALAGGVSTAFIYFFLQITASTLSSKYSIQPINTEYVQPKKYIHIPKLFLGFSFFCLVILIIILILSSLIKFDLSQKIIILPFLETFIAYIFLANVMRVRNPSSQVALKILYARLKGPMVVFIIISFIQYSLLVLLFSFDRRVLLMGVGIGYFCLRIYLRYHKEQLFINQGNFRK